MKIFTSEFEDRLVSIIGTAIVLSIAILIIGLVGWVEVGMCINVNIAIRRMRNRSLMNARCMCLSKKNYW